MMKENPRSVINSVLESLVSNQTSFIRFLSARLPDAEAAEDVFQQGLLKAIEKQTTLKRKDRVIPWFYSVLRNGVVDYYRAQERDGRNASRYVCETAPSREPDGERNVCNCFRNVLPTLKPSYAELLNRVDLQGMPISEVAAKLRITPNNLMVRLHRARRALRKRLEQVCGECAGSGCLNCTCPAKL
jgi:RNA polymerase sigma-70 factor (ECF subfamily)